MTNMIYQLFYYYELILFCFFDL